MLDVLLLRFDAPLIAFGATLVDSVGAIQDHPARSMVTGLLANALGYHHGEHAALAALQDRLVFATRQDLAGEPLQDFQTVSLGQDHLLDKGWTTRGAVEGREGGSASTGTHIRYRRYLAGAVYTLALTLAPAQAGPDLDAVEAALRRPERPLFLGRKACLPAAPILLGRVQAVSLLAALASAPPLPAWRTAPARWRLNRTTPSHWLAWWPPDAWTEADAAWASPDMTIEVTEDRDWQNQLVVGQRDVCQGRLTPAAPAVSGAP